MKRLLDHLAGCARFGMRPGLEAIDAVAAALGHPERSFPSIHIAGTNGKGAVAAILDAALRARSLVPVARYTSPHLVRINERFFIDDVESGKITVADAAQMVGELNQYVTRTNTTADSISSVGVEYAVPNPITSM